MTELPDWVVGTAFVLLLVAAGCALYRVAKGPTLADRVIALDVVLVSLMSGLALNAAARRDTSTLVVTIVVAIVAFTATVASTRFIERRSAR